MWLCKFEIWLLFESDYFASGIVMISAFTHTALFSANTEIR